MGSRHIKSGHTKTPRPVHIEKVFKYAVVEVQVDNDQENAQSEKKFPFQKPRWKKTKLTNRYL